MEFINYSNYERQEDIKRLRFIINNLPDTKESLNILEIGCGNGNISHQLARVGHKVTGIDISEETIKNANLQYGNTAGLIFAVGNAEIMKYDENEKYDVIVCSEVLEHLHHPENLTKNFKHMLNKDGVAIVTVPNGFGPRELIVTRPAQKMLVSDGMIAKLVLKLKAMLGYKGNNKQTSADYLQHVQFFSFRALKKIANNAGYRILKKKGGNFLDNTFPFSLLMRKSSILQKLDCFLADILPLSFSSAFYTVWTLNTEHNG